MFISFLINKIMFLVLVKNNNPDHEQMKLGLQPVKYDIFVNIKVFMCT